MIECSVCLKKYEAGKFTRDEMGGIQGCVAVTGSFFPKCICADCARKANATFARLNAAHPVG